MVFVYFLHIESVAGFRHTKWLDRSTPSILDRPLDGPKPPRPSLVTIVDADTNCRITAAVLLQGYLLPGFWAVLQGPSAIRSQAINGRRASCRREGGFWLAMIQ